MHSNRSSIAAIRGTVLAGATAALLAALGQPAAAQANFDRATSVIFANGGALTTLDPLRTDYAQTSFAVNAAYDTLVTYDKSAKVVGRLAESFEVADDVMSIAIKLRPGVAFQDGAPLTADDVAYTLDRLKRIGIGIAGQISEYDSTVVTDPHTLTIKLKQPSSIFLGALSKIYILNSKLVGGNAGSDDGQTWLQSHVAGSGPYSLSIQQGGNTFLQLNPNYWDKAEGRPQTIVLRRIDEGATQRDEIRAGNVDLAILGMGYRDAADLEASGVAKDARLKPALQTNVVFNTRTGPTADPRVRRAVRMAYDYEGGLKNIRLGNGTVANGPLPSTLPCRPDLPQSVRDVEGAKKLLAEAGVKDLHLTLRFQSTIEVQRLEATLLQSNLADIGVTLDLQPITFANYLQTLASVDTIPQMMLLDDFAQFPDPGAMLFKTFKSNAVGTNRSGYSNAEVDKLLDQAVQTKDDAARCELYKKAQTIIDGDSAYLSMYTVGRPGPYRAEQLAPLEANLVVFPVAPSEFRLAK